MSRVCAACGQPATVLHHDHGAPHGCSRSEIIYWRDRPHRAPRFPPAPLCYSCNQLDGAAKRVLGLPRDFSFSPPELWLIAGPPVNWGVQRSVNRRAAEALVRVLRWRGILPPEEAPVAVGLFRRAPATVASSSCRGRKGVGVSNS